MEQWPKRSRSIGFVGKITNGKAGTTNGSPNDHRVVGAKISGHSQTFKAVACIITPMAYKKKPVGRQLSPDEVLKREALGIASYGTAEEFHEEKSSAIFGEGFEEIIAPSKETWKPPRAYYCGYHAEAELLVIIFRGPGKWKDKKWIADAGKQQPWIFYTDVDSDTWESLKVARSTGDWLRNEIGGYGWSDVPSNNKTGLKSVVDSILKS